jgi:pyruvate kinase
VSRRKIVATIGPATASVDAMRRLVDAGMGVARLNGSHATLDWHAQTVALIRNAAPDVPILLDIPGRKIRTARLDFEPTFASGDTVVLTTDLSYDGREKVPVNYADLHLDLSGGDVILADDGQLRFTVMRVDERDIVCRADAAGTLRSAKGINVPRVTLRTALVTDRDRHMLAFAREHNIDLVGISFVESAHHIQAIRDLIGGSRPGIVAKVENQRAMNHLDEIIGAADAIMIDRGDLSVETTLESVALSQKRILTAARVAACPVIVATEMLHSMIASPTPTKAEVSDITNAVLDGASALMLSGETAVGAFPFAAVATMRRILDCAAAFVGGSGADQGQDELHAVPSAVSDAVGLLCARTPITKIVAITISGFAARMVASQFPRQPIFAVSNDADNARAFNLLPGVAGVHVDVPFSRHSTDHIAVCLEHLWRRGLVADSDLALVVAVGYPRSGNRMNLLQVHRIDDLRQALAWKANR